MSCQNIAWISQMLPTLIPTYIIVVCCASSFVGWSLLDEMKRKRARHVSMQKTTASTTSTWQGEESLVALQIQAASLH